MSDATSQSLLGLVGNTPLVKLERFDTGPCELFVKLENQNPGGSIKDRIALSMIEATAGNTGLGLAFIAVRKGYKLLLVMPDKMSREKISHLRAMGADVRITRSDVAKGHPAYYQDLAATLAKELGAYYINQFENPANPLAHERTTAPEIWQQTGQKLDAVVCGVGSGGTITGLSRYFAREAPHVELVLGDPAGSVLADYVKTGDIGQAGSWLVEGIGEDFLPSICDLSRVKKSYTIGDEESLTTARSLLEREGILAGSSSGLLVAAALRYCREQTQPKRVVTFICDSGNKYLSKMFNDLWMREQGFLRNVGFGDLRDLVSRRADDGTLVSVSPEETLLIAYQRMKLADVSQVPVLEGEKIVGMIDESDLLLAVHEEPARFREPVRRIMTRNLVTVEPSASIESLSPLFDRGLVVILMVDGKFDGLITRMDVLNHLRRRLG